MKTVTIDKTVRHELDSLDSLAFSIKKANTDLGGKHDENWQENDMVINIIMNVSSWADVHGDDVTDLIYDDLTQNYNVHDTDSTVMDLEYNVKDHKELDTPLDIAKRTLESAEESNGSWTEDRGSMHGLDQYFTDPISSDVLSWIEDIKKIIKGDQKACEEA